MTSDPAGINCPTNATRTYDFYRTASGTTVNLNATPINTDWEFSSWTGDCATTSTTCTVTLDGPKSVTASWGYRG